MRSTNKVVANAVSANAVDPRSADEVAVLTAYKKACLKAAEDMQRSLDALDGAYTSSARIALSLPDDFTRRYEAVSSVRIPLRLFIAQCRQPL